MISLADDAMISTTVQKHNSDRHVKYFKSHDHYFSIIFVVCTCR
ncbi:MULTISPECIES: hypothetical protein [unclassified Flavobacterium]|nr:MULTISPECIES: hypothetical protein [unclassified Flavobacterium]